MGDSNDLVHETQQYHIMNPVESSSVSTTNKEDTNESSSKEGLKCTPFAIFRFGGVKSAVGYNYGGIGRGALIMTNIFLSTSFVHLARDKAGCLDEDKELIEDCDGKVYGFQPSSFVSNIAVITSVLSALFMPLVGAVVDYTEHRRSVGIYLALAMVLIQAVQIGTVEKTWVIMVMLQAISGVLYQALVLVVYAYLPEISYVVGETTMAQFTSVFQMSQFTSQALFLVVIIALSYALDLGDVSAAQTSQAINVLWTGAAFYMSWKNLGHVKKRHTLPEGKSLLGQGFSQVFTTVKDINRLYKRGTRWFFLSLVFAEAGTNAFTVVSVVFLGQQLGMTFQEIGIFFFFSLVSSAPGTFIGQYVNRKLDPIRSWQLVMMFIFIWTAGGALLLDRLPSNLYNLAYVWGCGVGLLLGWFYPTENLFFCMCLPPGQEAELSGFLVYCTQILGWLPPLVFTFMVEANVSQTYGVIAVAVFHLIAVALLGCAAPWDEILEESGRTKSGLSDKEADVAEGCVGEKSDTKGEDETETGGATNPFMDEA